MNHIEEFEAAYKRVYENVVTEGIPQKKHCVMFLGGQPGAGKSNFYSQDDCLNQYIVIDGDKYRKYHPAYEEIVRTDKNNYANRTQEFVNYCVEHLIEQLSDEGYNLIIEGTLRNPETTIQTCQRLNSKGYCSELVVIAADATEAWYSTLNRAKLMEDCGETPRYVPVEKYDFIVNRLADSVSHIEEENCFHQIRVVNRINEVLYDSCNGGCAKDAVAEVLDIERWNQELDLHIEEYHRATFNATEENDFVPTWQEVSEGRGR